MVAQNGRVSFALGPYDTTQPLTIDPALTYSSYLAGSDYEFGATIAVDREGNAYVTGQTLSADFPADPLVPNATVYYDAYVTKLNAAGTEQIYSTFFGGSDTDGSAGIAVDQDENAYIVGNTWSNDFPAPNPIRACTLLVDLCLDMFIVKLNAAGNGFVYTTYLGGEDWDGGRAIAVDDDGNAYVTGDTHSIDFYTLNPLQANINNPVPNVGYADAFVAKINAAGTAFVYSTYLGGTKSDAGLGIAADDDGNAYIVGDTTSNDLPPVATPPLRGFGGGTCYSDPCRDAFVLKLNALGSAIDYRTYLGGSAEEWSGGIAVDSARNVYVAGTTTSTDFLTVAALDDQLDGDADAFVTKLNAAGDAWEYSTYLGGSDWDDGYGIAVDQFGNALVTGDTGSADFPVVNSVQAYGENWDAFVAKLNPLGSAFIYNTYLGGSGGDGGQAIVVDSNGDAYVTGYTDSTDFPPNDGTSQPGGNGDAFVTKIGPGLFDDQNRVPEANTSSWHMPPPQLHTPTGVNSRTGNYWTSVTDLAVQTPGPALEWTRTYASQAISDTLSGLSPGWQHSYATRVITPTMQGGEAGRVNILSPKGIRRRASRISTTMS